MALIGATYSTNPDTFNIDGVKAGDAAAMESRFLELIQGDTTPDSVADVVLAQGLAELQAAA